MSNAKVIPNFSEEVLYDSNKLTKVIEEAISKHDFELLEAIAKREQNTAFCLEFLTGEVLKAITETDKKKELYLILMFIVMNPHSSRYVLKAVLDLILKNKAEPYISKYNIPEKIAGHKNIAYDIATTLYETYHQDGMLWALASNNYVPSWIHKEIMDNEKKNTELRFLASKQLVEKYSAYMNLNK